MFSRYKYIFIAFFICIISLPEICISKTNLVDLYWPFLNRLKNRTLAFKQNSIKIDYIKLDGDEKNLKFSLSKSFAVIPYRYSTVQDLSDSLRSQLPDSLKSYSIDLYIDGRPIVDYIPNFYRTDDGIDKDRLPRKDEDESYALIQRIDKKYEPTKGLLGRHLALWNSHGVYYDTLAGAWQWQRPRLFTITEDTYTTSLMLPYLLPMLDNAGATTLLARERDTQNSEVIVDYDSYDEGSYVDIVNSPKFNWTSDSVGFAKNKTVYYEGDNPFMDGTNHVVKSKKNGVSTYQWIPNIPKTGYYAVYVSYRTFPKSIPDAHYKVFYYGDSTEVVVNQQMGGSMWVYLGTFKFKKGVHPEIGSVQLTNASKFKGLVSADAVKFGGGMGNIARGKKSDAKEDLKISGKPRFLEGARYNLQWSGFSDSVYSPNKGASEYKDDYMSRAHWVNALAGGSYKLPDRLGKNIPVDMALAIHTDAGTSSKYIGTMSIYMTNNNNVYADGQRRIASRDLADLVQTEVVNDIRNNFDSTWTRRKLTDESYYEARVPEVPTMLLEFLSHQNFKDMSIALDPHFRFTVSRAIYKGILKFIASQYQTEYVVQPLPVKDFYAEFENTPDTLVHLSWTDQLDSLEPSAIPQKYILYTAIGDQGFDNGTLLENPNAVVSIVPGKIYRFKVTAVNDGGESFPSEILSVAKAKKENGKVLIVNGFNRISGPCVINENGVKGVGDSLNTLDLGVPYKDDISYTGPQYDYNAKSVFIDNEHPGLGASTGEWEDSIVAGNSFDYPYIHGISVLNAGYTFTSASSSAFGSGALSTSGIDFIDYILGEQKKSDYGYFVHYELLPENVQSALTNYLDIGGNLLITGQYIGSESTVGLCDSSNIEFNNEYLHFSAIDSLTSQTNILTFDTSYANITDTIYFVDSLNSRQYPINSPEIISAIKGGSSMLYVDDNKKTVEVCYKGDYRTIASSVPFETIEGLDTRNKIMKIYTQFFKKEKKELPSTVNNNAHVVQKIDNLKENIKSKLK